MHRLGIALSGVCIIIAIAFFFLPGEASEAAHEAAMLMQKRRMQDHGISWDYKI